MLIQEMLLAHPREGSPAAEALLTLVEAAHDCSQACTACADACTAEEAVADLRGCI
ncbi:hypothetical protein [Pseudoroseicyclus aestuarii]|uniref:Uncharacterized protein n=1 Tax=Pseudoroseicyclus aestuarii TaxID=1795041 RepID=A0A318SZV6_9RHOB|nr:hypothetical protein [Pseudoroseicyclus aestuarii]PYE82357.1 hypothetical protein DFP88_104111 [Pseudoroseicyclus aestuarii]